MQFSQVLQALGQFASGIAPRGRAIRPLEIDLDETDAPSPFEQAAIGTWKTEDGAILIDLRPDGQFHKCKPAAGAQHRGRYAVDRSKLYFEGESGWVALGKLKRGRLSIGEKQFHKA
ncbi:Atu4866 domain-containing protein [Bosea sp. (in: a-proteobacteria)]|uniref:Atu4866 domain-containing protein n=1 Tax=Bosea sp. (in: a-proteobacteria) TaxID=1871050 RepID=UPI003341F91C